MSDRLPPPLLLFFATALGSAACNPFLAPLLSSAGLPDWAIPWALAALPLGTLFGAPMWARFADRRGSVREAIQIGMACVFVAGVLVAALPSGILIAAAILPFAMARASGSLGDGLAVSVLGENRGRYGQIRATGSLAYLLVAFVGSLVHQAWPRAPLLISLGLTAATIGVVSSLPDAVNPPRAAAPPMGPIIRRSLPFLIVSTLHGMALVGFDAWWPFHVERIGLPGWVAGAGVAAAVFVEVSIMFAGRSLFARFRPESLVLCAIAAGIPQWALTAWVAEPWVLIAAQGLRGAAFGAFWIAGVELLAGRSPPETRASAQSLLPATSYGIGFLLQVGLSGAVLAFGTTRTLCATFAVVEIVALVAFLLLSRAAPSPLGAPAGSPADRP